MARSPASRAERPRAWQRMLSGRRLDLLEPSPLDIEIEDIAHGLARVARWNGQTSGPHVYSVAQHSLLVDAIAAGLEPGLAPCQALAVLFHDAPEYVVGDVISPFKAVIGEAYREVETRLLAAIHLRFGLAPVPDEALRRLTKRADRMAAHLEATRLAGFSSREALALFGRPPRLDAEVERLLRPWPAEEAKGAYLARFQALQAG